MMTMELEREIIGILLKEPCLINEVTCQAEWFMAPLYQEIFVTLDLLKGEKHSLFDIYNFLKMVNQHSEITFQELVEIEASIVTTSQINSHIATLHREFLDTSLIALTKKASSHLSDTIKIELKEILSQIERLNMAKDLGQLETTYSDMAYMLENDGDYGIKTYANLDYKLGGGFFGGMLITIGARPGVGKTAFATVNLVEQAIRNNQHMAVDVFTLEMSKKELVNRFVSLHTGIPTVELRRPNKLLSTEQKEKVRTCLAHLKTYNLRIHDSSSTIQKIRNHIKARVFEHGNKPYMVVIDYLGLVKTDERHNDRRLEIESITRELKILANELNIVIVLLSQLSRGVEHRQDKTPVLSDLRESGSIEQDSNVVGFLHHPDERNPNEKELIIRKNREGSLGILRYRFDGAKMTFEPVYE